MLHLANLLRSDSELLLQRWVDRLREGIAPGGEPEFELRDHIPALLAELEQALREGQAPERSAAAEVHGRQRYRVGFSIEQLVLEYAALQDVIFALLEERRQSLTMGETRDLVRFVSEAVATGVTEYGKRRDERTTLLTDELTVRETQLRLVTDALPMLVSFVDAEERYGFVNKAYEDWFGIPIGSVVGRSVQEIVGDAAYAVMGPYVHRALAGEKFSFEQHDVPYETGGVRDVRVTFVPLGGPNGTTGGYVGLVEDITAQRILSLERERLAQHRVTSLERQSLFEQQLIGIVSHDLRTPLHVVSLSSARLARLEELSPSAIKNVVRIQNAAERAARMVADLLDFTQARLGGGIPIERRPADLHKLVDALMVELEAAYPDRQLEAVQEGDGLGQWDPERITQVAQNLVTNALKYGDPQSSVRVTTRADENRVLLLVHNWGTPIASDKLPVLFEPMQRGVEQIDKVSRSVGLGLYIVKQIVDAHGGQVNVHSSETDGTTFSVRLPRTADL